MGGKRRERRSISGGEVTEEQLVGPSSRASREAAASNCTSEGSQPPFGTKRPN